MRNELDERLVWLNGENYDCQWKWNDIDEMKEDIIEFFQIDEEDQEEIEETISKVEWDGKGEYVYSGLEDRVMTLEDALDEEFNSAIILVGQYDSEQQAEILEWVYSEDEVEEMCYKIKNFTAPMDEDNSKTGKEVALEWLQEDIQELEKKGYNTEFVQDTMHLFLGSDDVVEVYFLVVRTQVSA